MASWRRHGFWHVARVESPGKRSLINWMPVQAILFSGTLLTCILGVWDVFLECVVAHSIFISDGGRQYYLLTCGIENDFLLRILFPLVLCWLRVEMDNTYGSIETLSFSYSYQGTACSTNRPHKAMENAKDYPIKTFLYQTSATSLGQNLAAEQGLGKGVKGIEYHQRGK